MPAKNRWRLPPQIVEWISTGKGIAAKAAILTPARIPPELSLKTLNPRAVGVQPSPKNPVLNTTLRARAALVFENPQMKTQPLARGISEDDFAQRGDESASGASLHGSVDERPMIILARPHYAIRTKYGTVIKDVYGIEEWLALKTYGLPKEKRVAIDNTKSWPIDFNGQEVKHVWIFNPDVAVNMFVNFFGPATGGDESVQIAPTEGREFDLFGITMFQATTDSAVVKNIRVTYAT